MARLSRYLLRLFAGEAMALFAVAAFLLFLIQCLRLFDLVVDKGQSLITLIGQAAISMPQTGVVFLYVCLGIGVGRTLRNLQGTSELQVIHSSGLVPALLRAALTYASLGGLLLLFISHLLDPWSQESQSKWQASVAADLVSRAMVPHRFVSIVDNVQMVIGSRDGEGNITDFFANDTRNPLSQRTYFAKTAILTRDERGYVLRLHDGATQYFTADKRMSQVAFQRYDLPLDKLTQDADQANESLSLVSSIELVRRALATGDWNKDTVGTLYRRTGEGLRGFALTLFITALAAFPTGKRRRFAIPVELSVLAAVFIERGVSSYLRLGGIFNLGSGAVIMLILALIILIVRLRVLRPVRRVRRLA